MKKHAPQYFDKFIKSNGKNLDSGIHCLLQAPARILKSNIPLKMDDGTISLVQFTRYIYTDYLGPGLGPLYISEDITDEFLLLDSFENTIKNSLMGLPFGGASGCLRINPKNLTPGEIERLARGLVFMNHQNMGPEIDVYYLVDEKYSGMMNYINSTYNIVKGKHGMPVALGNVNSKFNRKEFQLLSLLEVIKKAISFSDLKIDKISFVMGSTTKKDFMIAKILEDKYNAKLIAIKANNSFFLVNQHKNSQHYHELTKTGKQLIDLPEEKYMNTEETFKIKSDIMILDCGETFTTVEYNKSHFSLIFETCNTSQNFKLDKLFHAKSKLYIPAIVFSIWETAYCALKLLNCRNFCYISNNRLIIDRYLSLLNKPLTKIGNIDDLPFRVELLKLALNNLQEAIIQKGIMP